MSIGIVLSVIMVVPSRVRWYVGNEIGKMRFGSLLQISHPDSVRYNFTSPIPIFAIQIDCITGQQCEIGLCCVSNHVPYRLDWISSATTLDIHARCQQIIKFNWTFTRWSSFESTNCHRLVVDPNLILVRCVGVQIVNLDNGGAIESVWRHGDASGYHGNTGDIIYVVQTVIHQLHVLGCVAIVIGPQLDGIISGMTDQWTRYETVLVILVCT
mmetsp:Transcript_110510/g.165402  ORF Transcript_110510/g.165402 Transcript_110510/m.165402 type:complete len:213 (+) Transcript_110510:765-1403(+)